MDGVINVSVICLPLQVNNPSLRFSFTLATLGTPDSGISQLNSLGNSVMQAIQATNMGWNNLFINIMTMDYGTGSGSCTMGSDGHCQMGQSAINAAESMNKFWKVPYSSIEITPMIGGNDDVKEVFSLADVATVTAYAVSKGLGGLHHWSFDRDTDCAAGSYASSTCNSFGTAGTLGFTKAFIKGLGQ